MADSAQALLFQAMSDPAFYPHEVQGPHQEETHISKVFLTGRYVYKVKKPVDLGFVDFRDLACRHFYCEQEVILNRRLTDDVYLGVVAICFDGHNFQINGAGQPAEYAVKMRQLPAGRTMAHLLAADLIGSADIERLALKLAAFHQAAPPVADPAARTNLQTACTDNFRQVMPHTGQLLDARQYDDVRAATFNYFIRQKALIERRIAANRFREGHGDLRAEHIYLTADGRIQILDCIEFNERLRIVDTASDLAFLIMDLEYRQKPQAARHLLETCYRHCDDCGLPAMMDFYKCYRAMVRCKVHCLQLKSADAGTARGDALVNGAREHLRLAHAYAQRYDRPILWVFCGLPGTGKSELASRLADILVLANHNSDRVRKRLQGFDPLVQVQAPLDDGIYAPEVDVQVYDQLLNQARKSIREGCSVILDATYRTAADRNRLRRLADGCGARILFVECRAPDDLVLKRLRQREQTPSVSDARCAHHAALKARFEPLTELLPRQHIVLDTSKSATACLRDLFMTAYLDRPWGALRQKGINL
jgi:uncharacterized protein